MSSSNSSGGSGDSSGAPPSDPARSDAPSSSFGTSGAPPSTAPPTSGLPSASATPTALLIALPAAVVPVDLFRSGNASSPKMDHVRLGHDLTTETVTTPGRVEIVMVNPDGGISTWDGMLTDKGAQKWWLIPAGTPLPPEISVTRDHNVFDKGLNRSVTHYTFKPSRSMEVSTFLDALRVVGAVCTRSHQGIAAGSTPPSNQAAARMPLAPPKKGSGQ